MRQLHYIYETRKQNYLTLSNKIDALDQYLRNKVPALMYLWFALAAILKAFTYAASWVACLVYLSRNNQFTCHFMEFEMKDQGVERSDALRYLDAKLLEYKRQLSNGSISGANQDQIENAFEYLYSKYTFNVEAITAHQSIPEVTNVVVEERKEVGWNHYNSKLTQEQISILVAYINTTCVFSDQISIEVFNNLLLCQLEQPLRLANARTLTYLFNLLYENKYIHKTWQTISFSNKNFVSHKGKTIVQSDLSSSKNVVADGHRPKGADVIDIALVKINELR